MGQELNTQQSLFRDEMWSQYTTRVIADEGIKTGIHSLPVYTASSPISVEGTG